MPTQNNNANISFACYAIEQLFPENYEPEDLLTQEDSVLHKLAKPITGRSLRTLLQAYRGLKATLLESR